jgi:chemotaxis methyl-accepting protein methylase
VKTWPRCFFGQLNRSNGIIMKLKESDWKKFRNSLDKWRERYLKRKNDEIRAILEDNDLNETEKFWDIVDFQKNESKILRNCLYVIQDQRCLCIWLL